jgi:hypothetical protein
MGPVKILLHEGLARMGKRTVPDVMKERGSNNENAFLVGMPEPPACNIGKEHSAKRVLEPRVVGTWIDEVRKSKLFDIAETLQRWRIQQREQEILHFNIPVDRVLDDLHKFTKRIFIYIA